MESNDPIWLDTRFVRKILQKINGDESINVSNLIVKPAVTKGDNYLSDLHRVSVEFSRYASGQKIVEYISLIVKISPSGDFREDMISQAGLFGTEMSMMSDTLPRLNEMMREMNASPLAAKCIYTQNEVPIHLIIEDLAPKGYQMANRIESLDLNHCLISLKKLAAFHATSVSLAEKDPETVTKYRRGLFHEDHPPSLSTFFIASTKALGEEVAKWHELSARISEKILKMSEDIYKKTCESALMREDDFNVLNHGDCWLNNMMFLYDEKKNPVDVIFVDFQMSRYGSPALDLLYFFATTPNDDLRAHKREMLLREYHTSLTSTMAELKCSTQAPSFEKLQEMLRRRAFYEVTASFVVLPLVLIDKKDQKSLDEMMGADGEYENRGYQNKIYRDVMIRVLPLYDDLGLLDQ